jgi:hypothetical protein
MLQYGKIARTREESSINVITVSRHSTAMTDSSVIVRTECGVMLLTVTVKIHVVKQIIDKHKHE